MIEDRRPRIWMEDGVYWCALWSRSGPAAISGARDVVGGLWPGVTPAAAYQCWAYANEPVSA